MYTHFPAEALVNGNTIRRSSWNEVEELKLIKPEEWEGPFEIGQPMIAKKDTMGCWGPWCNCTGDILANDWEIKS